MKMPQEIYLIPSSDLDYDYEWCDHPAPTDSHDASEAVRYVRADVVDGIAQERDRLEAILQDVNTADYRFSVDQLATHDAAVIEKVASELKEAFPHHTGVYYWLIGLAYELRQKAQEAQ